MTIYFFDATNAKKLQKFYSAAKIRKKRGVHFVLFIIFAAVLITELC